MEHIDFKKLANQIMFDLDAQEQAELKEEFDILQEQIELLDKIDTSDVEEMVYPFEQATVYLREDEVHHVLSQKEALGNAAAVKMGHVHVPKVVKS